MNYTCEDDEIQYMHVYMSHAHMQGEDDEIQYMHVYMSHAHMQGKDDETQYIHVHVTCPYARIIRIIICCFRSHVKLYTMMLVNL